jgi:glycerol-1-phosphate dehydrogenase [NAD(P)+]
MNIDELLKLAGTTQVYRSGDGIAAKMPELLRRVTGEASAANKLILVADENTWNAAGKELEAVLADAGIALSFKHIFPGSPMLKAEYKHVELLVDVLGEREGFILAVGSGTINDLVKMACGELGRPYGIVATAASMDGYCAQGAAILKDGFKQTLNCPAALLVAADSRVLADAHPDMTAAGFADLAAKQVSGLDWILADRLGADTIDPVAWKMVYDGLENRLQKADEVGRGDTAAITGLFEGLAATGFALQYYRQSRPASGTEHQFSHVLEMEGWEHGGRLPSHGFKVALGSLVSLSLYLELLKRLENGNLPEPAAAAAGFPDAEVEEAEVRRFYAGSQGVEEILAVLRSKRPTSAVLLKRLEWAAENHETLAAELRENMPNYQEFRRRLKAAGAPSAVSDLGLTAEKTQNTILAARYIRDRYGVLDYLFELGILEEVAELISTEV